MPIVTILGFTPHYCYYCSSFTLLWVFVSGSTVINIQPLVLAWWHNHDVTSVANWCWTNITMIARDYIGSSFHWTCARKLGVSPNLISTFPMLPNPFSYSESESLLLRQRSFLMALYFLIAFSCLSNFFLNRAKDCFAGLRFFLFSWKRKSWLFLFCLSCTYNNPFCCAWYMCSHVFEEVAMLLSASFFEDFGHRLSTRSLVSFLALIGSFLVGLCIWSFLGTYALDSLRDIRNKRMSTGSYLSCEGWTDPAMYVVHLKNVTCQISLSKWYVHGNHTRLCAWAVEPAGQLCYVVGIELFYMLHKLMHTDVLEFLSTFVM